jgi:hypothetical protein
MEKPEKQATRKGNQKHEPDKKRGMKTGDRAPEG